MTQLIAPNNNFQVGDIVRVKDDVEWIGESRETTILGILSSINVFVEAPEERGYTRDFNGAKYHNTWNVATCNLELVRRCSSKVISAYTKTCKYCSHPARTIGKTLFCSNDRCRSRYRFKKSFPVPYVKLPKDVDADNFVICHECKERVIYLDIGPVPAPSYMVKCKNNHARQHIFLEGQQFDDFEPTSKKHVGYVFHRGAFKTNLSFTNPIQ